MRDVAPMIQRILPAFMPGVRTRLGPALVVYVLGAAIGALSGWNSATRKKWWDDVSKHALWYWSHPPTRPMPAFSCGA
jgi:hypothetical protein